MPGAVKIKHKRFVQRFGETGKSVVLNNRMSVFIKKKNGKITPVEIFVKFNYSTRYHYTFLAIFKPIKDMAPFSDGVTYSTDRLLYLMADNDTSAHVSDYSDGFEHLLFT
jgi:hypothetical protein